MTFYSSVVSWTAVTMIFCLWRHFKITGYDNWGEWTGWRIACLVSLGNLAIVAIYGGVAEWLGSTVAETNNILFWELASWAGIQSVVFFYLPLMMKGTQKQRRRIMIVSAVVTLTALLNLILATPIYTQ